MDLNTLRPRQMVAILEDVFKCISLNENVWISMFVPRVQINNIPALFKIMAWHRLGAKPLSAPSVLLKHICITRPHWVKWLLKEPLHWRASLHCGCFVSVILRHNEATHVAIQSSPVTTGSILFSIMQWKKSCQWNYDSTKVQKGIKQVKEVDKLGSWLILDIL